MKELTERRIRIFEKDPDDLGEEIFFETEKMHQKGWFFTDSKTDALLEYIYLFFERDIDA